MNPLLPFLLSITVSVSNPLDTPRESVPVVIPIDQQEEVNSVQIKNHPTLPYQLDDTDMDGRFDELVILLDLKAKATETLNINLSSKPQTTTFEPETYAYIRLNDKNKKHPKVTAISYPGDVENIQMYNSIYGHGAVLEGLHNAIRVYMDNRQSIDLYAKNHPQLELDSTGFYTTREQLAKGYGRDILWAGTSVALGSFRGYQNNKPVTIDTVASRTQKVIANGPLRSIIEVEDRGWMYNGKTLHMTQRYTIYGGHRDIDVDVTINNAPNSNIYSTGVQKLESDNEGFIQPDGLAGSWGSNIPDKGMKDVVDTLGLGIYVPAPYLKETKEDDVNYLTVLKADSNGHIKYTITSGAVRDITSPHNAADWFAYLRQWQNELQHPVKVTITK